MSRLKKEPMRNVVDEDAFWGVESVGVQSDLSGKKDGLCFCVRIFLGYKLGNRRKLSGIIGERRGGGR